MHTMLTVTLSIVSVRAAVVICNWLIGCVEEDTRFRGGRRIQECAFRIGGFRVLIEPRVPCCSGHSERSEESRAVNSTPGKGSAICGPSGDSSGTRHSERSEESRAVNSARGKGSAMYGPSGDSSGTRHSERSGESRGTRNCTWQGIPRFARDGADVFFILNSVVSHSEF